MKRVLIFTAIAAAAFLIGFVPTRMALANLRESSQQTREDLEQRLRIAQENERVARLAGTLGVVLMDVREDNFGKARERATEFFDAVRAISASTSNEMLRMALSKVLERRDAVTATLVANKPEASKELQALFKELYDIITSPGTSNPNQ